MKPTLQDIATETGLSLSTVSRILSSRKRKNTQNEALVISCAKRLNYPYIQNDTGSGLDKQARIALVTEMFEGEFYSSLFYWFHIAAKEMNTRLNIIEASPKNLSSPVFVNDIRKSYDGVCIFNSGFEAADYQNLNTLLKDMPAISLAPIINPVIDTVSFDTYRGGHLVAQHFDNMGFREVGIITGPRKNIEALYRRNGFLDYIESSDRMNCVWRFNGDYSVESGHRAYEDLKERGLQNIAIFGSNDQTCLGLMKCILEDGKKIPDDYAVAGYDNMPICEIFYPSLTSVATDFKELGKASISILEKKIQGQNDSHGHVSLVPVSLIVRSSTQPQK